MRHALLVSIAALGSAVAIAAFAEDRHPMDHQMHMAAAGGDSRQLVSFPADMRTHTLANMRDHLHGLSEIVAAMSNGKYTEAGKIAAARLGMDSPSAAGCKSEDPAAPQMSKPPKAGDMDHRMAQFMPEGMRDIGLKMHQSASVFASEAARAGKTGNAKAALAALSRVTEQCVACHAGYRLQ